MQSRRSAFDNLVQELNTLRLLGKDGESSSPNTPSGDMPQLVFPEDGEEGNGGGTDGGREKGSSRAGTPSSLNPDARPFQSAGGIVGGTGMKLQPPQLSHLRQSYTPGPSAPSTNPGTPAEEGEDVEMGEVAEGVGAGGNGGGSGSGRKRVKKELEEGEASDGSNDLTDLEDDAV